MATESTTITSDTTALTGKDRQTAANASDARDKLFTAATPVRPSETPSPEAASKQPSATPETASGNQLYDAFKTAKTPSETARVLETYRQLSPSQQAAADKEIQAAAAKDPDAATTLAQLNRALYGDTFNSSTPAATSDVSAFDKQLAAEQQALVHSHPGVIVGATESLLRDDAALNNVKNVLTSVQTPDTDKLRAAAVLAANGQTELKTAQGADYKFQNLPNGTTELSYKESAQGAVQKLTGEVGKDGNLISINGQSVATKAADHLADPGVMTRAEAGVAAPPEVPRTPKDTLFDPSSSMEDKLKAAGEMAKNGQRKFIGPDGKQYEIATKNYGDRESIDVEMGDGHGHSHPVLRGILEKNGEVKQQHDKHGRGVDFTSDWAKAHDADSNLTKHDQPRQTPERHETPEVHERPSPQTPRTELEEARERLRDDAQKNIPDETARRDFLAHMDQFEQRAKNENLPEKQISDTYKQLSRLLEAQDGKASKDDRVLAAEGFALHMGDPKTKDQGQHATCNVTSVAKREMFINPATQAEMITTVALTGEYVAHDGKHIKIDQDSLTPWKRRIKAPPSRTR